MIIKTTYGIDYWECPDTFEQTDFIHIPPFNNHVVTIAYRVGDAPLIPLSYDDDLIEKERNANGMTGCAIGEFLTLDTETGLVKFYDGDDFQQQLTIYPEVLETIQENLEADPNGLEKWNRECQHAPQ